MMARRSLVEAYRSLQPPADDAQAWSTQAVLPGAGVLLGRSTQGPALLVPWGEGDTPLLPVRLKNLHVMPGATCSIVSDGAVQTRRMNVCACLSDDAALQEVFVAAVDCLLPLSGSYTAADLKRGVDSLIELFRAVDKPARESVIGVWGELCTMLLASRPEDMLDAWHREATEHWDFSVDDERLEVKTTTGQRDHRFSLDQLIAPAGSRVSVVSIVTRPLTGGLTIIDLVQRIVERCVDPNAPSRLIAGLADVLGSDTVVWRDISFDFDAARESLRLVASAAVPRPVVIVDEVWDVSFTASLQGVEALPTGQRGKLSSLLDGVSGC